VIVEARVVCALADAFAEGGLLEVCGLLLGKKLGRGGVITDIARSRSSAPAHGKFEIPDSEIHRIRAWAADRGLDILAVFHSHRSGDARLSAADHAALRCSEWPWIVVTRPSRRGPLTLTGYAVGSGKRIHVETAGKHPDTDRNDRQPAAQARRKQAERS
jgi:proteasome lid subunit RPN8/RPN11